LLYGTFLKQANKHGCEFFFVLSANLHASPGTACIRAGSRQHHISKRPADNFFMSISHKTDKCRVCPGNASVHIGYDDTVKGEFKKDFKTLGGYPWLCIKEARLNRHSDPEKALKN
jgi:hypothetical protein